MVMHICTGCDYRFDTDNPLDCPNCGGEEIKKENSANELLDEVERILKDG